MKEYKYHYTYLITNQHPINDLQFYVGVKSCNVLPAENIEYMGSSRLLTADIKLTGSNNFRKIILKEFNTRDEAEAHEFAIHEEFDVAKNPLFYNKKNGTVGFHTTKESSSRQKETKHLLRWKKTKGKEQIRKRQETINNPSWVATTGAHAVRKQKETKNNITWKATVGKEQKRKLAETMNDPVWLESTGTVKSQKLKEIFNSPDWAVIKNQRNKNHSKTLNDAVWKATKGKEKSRKQQATKNNPVWKETVGKDRIHKLNETLNNPLWIKNNTFTCKHCGKTMRGRGMFNRWHGDNCKNRELHR
jgi:hypothetical protein